MNIHNKYTLNGPYPTFSTVIKCFCYIPGPAPNTNTSKMWTGGRGRTLFTVKVYLDTEDNYLQKATICIDIHLYTTTMQ